MRRRGGREGGGGRKWVEYHRGVNWGLKGGVRCRGCDGWQGQQQQLKQELQKQKQETCIEEEVEERQAGMKRETDINEGENVGARTCMKQKEKETGKAST